MFGPPRVKAAEPLFHRPPLPLPIGPLMAWKRGELAGVLQRLWWAALAAIVAGALVYAFHEPRKAFAGAGVALGVWLIVKGFDTQAVAALESRK